MNRKINSFTAHQRESWLQDCVAMFRDAVLTRRAATGQPTPACIAQAAMQFGVKESRGKALFYNELLTIRREAWMSMKLAACSAANTNWNSGGIQNVGLAKVLGRLLRMAAQTAPGCI